MHEAPHHFVFRILTSAEQHIRSLSESTLYFVFLPPRRTRIYYFVFISVLLTSLFSVRNGYRL